MRRYIGVSAELTLLKSSKVSDLPKHITTEDYPSTSMKKTLSLIDAIKNYKSYSEDNPLNSILEQGHFNEFDHKNILHHVLEEKDPKLIQNLIKFSSEYLQNKCTESTSFVRNIKTKLFNFWNQQDEEGNTILHKICSFFSFPDDISIVETDSEGDPIINAWSFHLDPNRKNEKVVTTHINEDRDTGNKAINYNPNIEAVKKNTYKLSLHNVIKTLVASGFIDIEIKNKDNKIASQLIENNKELVDFIHIFEIDNFRNKKNYDVSSEDFGKKEPEAQKKPSKPKIPIEFEEDDPKPQEAPKIPLQPLLRNASNLDFEEREPANLQEEPKTFSDIEISIKPFQVQFNSQVKFIPIQPTIKKNPEDPENVINSEKQENALMSLITPDAYPLNSQPVNLSSYFWNKRINFEESDPPMKEVEAKSILSHIIGIDGFNAIKNYKSYAEDDPLNSILEQGHFNKLFNNKHFLHHVFEQEDPKLIRNLIKFSSEYLQNKCTESSSFVRNIKTELFNFWNQQDEEGNTVLHKICSLYNKENKTELVDIIKTLVASGFIDIEIKNKDNKIASQLIEISKENEELIDHIHIFETNNFRKKIETDDLKKMRFSKLMESQHGKERLILNVAKRNFSAPSFTVQEFLILVNDVFKSEIDFNCTDYHGQTLLYYAIDKQNPDIAKFLLESGAYVDAKFRDKTPLHYAVENQNIEIIKLLLEHEAKCDIEDSQGKTPLHYAQEGQNVEIKDLLKKYNDDYIVRFLLESGADVDVKFKGKTFLHCAVENQNIEIIKLLLEHEAKCDIEDSQGKTPLHYAQEGQNVEIKDLLKRYNDNCKKERDPELKPKPEIEREIEIEIEIEGEAERERDPGPKTETKPEKNEGEDSDHFSKSPPCTSLFKALILRFRGGSKNKIQPPS